VRGKVREMQNRPDEAIEDYKEAWRHNMPRALPPLITLMLQQGKDLAELKKFDPTAPVDRLAAEVALLAGDRARAATFVRETTKSQAGQAGLEIWQANMLNLLGNRKDAEKELRDLAEKHPEQLNPWLTLLQYQVAAHQPKEAGETARMLMDRVVTDKPELVQARCSWLLGDRAAADRAFQDVIRKYPNDVEGRMYAANFEIENGRPDQAIDHLRQILKVDPNSRAAARKLAELLLERVDDLASWERAWEALGPGSGDEAPEDRLLRANILARHPEPSRRAEAIEILEGLRADLPVDLPFASTVREVLVKLLLQTRAIDRACRVAAISAAKNDPAAIALYAGALLQTGSWDEVERQLDRMHLIIPGDPRETRLRALLVIGRSGPEKAAEGLKQAVKSLGQKPEAEALCREAFGIVIQAGPRDAKIAEWLGRRLAEHRPAASWMPAQALVLQGEYDKAFDLCRIAAGTDSRADASAASQVALGVITASPEDAGYLQNAESVIEAARAHDPSAVDLLLMLAQVRRYQGRYEDEARIYRELLSREPDNLIVLNNLAWTLAEGMNKPDEALGYIDQVISRIGKNADTLDTRGVILTRLGRFDEAIEVLKEVVLLRPSASFYTHLARAYFKAGQDEQFRKYRDAARKAGFDAKKADPSERAELESMMKL
jgi:tetratricopeptide (TPR) repeat protein